MYSGNMCGMPVIHHHVQPSGIKKLVRFRFMLWKNYAADAIRHSDEKASDKDIHVHVLLVSVRNRQASKYLRIHMLTNGVHI